jgi:PAS domain S-box-containing protein
MISSMVDSHDRHMAQQALVHREALFRTLYERVPLGLALIKIDGSFLLANSALRSLTGFTEPELRKLTQEDITPPGYHGEDAQQLERLRLEGRCGPYRKEYLGRDGHRFPVVLNGIRVAQADGSESAWFLVQAVGD